ncbi:MAG: tetratricopeptide repeat protein [Promethearchaeota archaeon]|jgi:tetratricopeptide (TPR) repeat protein
MPDSRHEDLIRAERLINETKFNEALQTIENFEKKESLIPLDQVWTLLLKGRIYTFKGRFLDAADTGEIVFKLARKHDLVLESIHARILRSHILYSPKDFSGAGKAMRLLAKSEQIIDSYDDKTSLDIIGMKGTVYSLMAWFYMVTGESERALELAEKTLHFRKELGIKNLIALSYQLIARVYLRKGELDIALEYALQSLGIMEEIGLAEGISSSSLIIGNIYTDKGNLNQALNYLNKSLSFKDIRKVSRYQILVSLSGVYYRKNEINKSLECINQAKEIAQEPNFDALLVRCSYQLGYLYHLKGEHDLAIEILESSLINARKVRFEIATPLVLLVLVSLDKGSREQAQKYLNDLEAFFNVRPLEMTKIGFQMAKAMVLKTSGRTRNRAEAELLFKNIIEETKKMKYQFQSGTFSDMRMLSLVNLCDLYLEDLSSSNDLEILEDINPLITQMIQLANEKHSVIYLAESKLLQSKLALIQLKTTEAKKLLVEAQRIAETHEFDLLAAKISTEHDTLLTQLDVWDDFKEENASVSERIKLASLEGITDRLQQKRRIESVEVSEEESTLLLIIGEGGTLIFSYPFTDEWVRDEDLFSSFLSAFNSFSDEFFSEELDRVKFGQYTVLMEPVGTYNVCYLYKGQTYPAKQKLNKFIERIQTATGIWQNLEKFYQTSRVLELKDSDPLKSLIDEIFISKIT